MPVSAPPQPPQKREAAGLSVPHVGQSMGLARAYSPASRSTKSNRGGVAARVALVEPQDARDGRRDGFARLDADGPATSDESTNLVDAALAGRRDAESKTLVAD